MSAAPVPGLDLAPMGMPVRNDRPPDLGHHVYRSTTELDPRGRLVLDRRSRAWLAVTSPAEFPALAIPTSEQGGLLIVPVQDDGRRLEAVSA